MSTPFAAQDDIQSQRQGKALVMTNGVFDILHVGHLDFLLRAKALGDLLIVALNDDESVRRLKGPSRPVNPLVERAALVLALKPVDFVVSFNEDTPEAIIGQIKPDIHTKGGDYTVDQLPEAQIVKAYGGQTVILPYLEGHSTTRVVEALRAATLKPSS